MKKSRLFLGFIGIVALLVLIYSCYMAGVKKGQRSSTSDQQTNQMQTQNPAENETEGEDTEPEEDGAPQFSDLAIGVQMGASWEADGGYSVQMDITVTNQSDITIEEWNADITVPQETTLVQGWNGQYTIKGSVLHAVPVDYNTSIPAGETMTFGMIINSPQERYAVEEIIFSADGKTYSWEKGHIKDAPQDLQEQSKSQGDATATPLDESEAQGTDSQQQETSNDAGSSTKQSEANPVSKHGKLSVKGTKLVDKNGKAFQLRGISTHGIAWFPDYVSKSSFASLKKLFGINAIRLALYSDPGAGYTKDLHKKVKEGVKVATELGLYVIIDWHILGDGNPKTHEKEAKKFFEEMTKAYQKQDNIIYEICNEPNGDVTWDRDIKPYAKGMLKTIRKTDKDAVVIVGTPTWSQDVDIVAESPLKGQKNVMYALHFYAATHKDNIRDKAQKALDRGLPLFVSEFSICDASGNGGIDYDSAKTWMQFLNKNNISMMAWNLSNKNETSSLLSASCQKKKDYSKKDLSETGKWLLKQYR